MKKAYFIITGIVFLLLCFIVGFSAWNITQEQTVEIIPEAYQVISLDDATSNANIDAFVYNRNGFLDSSYNASYTTSFRAYYTLSAPSGATDVTFTLHDESNFLSSATITAKYYLKNGSNYDLESSASGKEITISVSSAIEFCIEYSITSSASDYPVIYNNLKSGKEAYIEAVASGSANWSINKKVNLLMKRYVDVSWNYASAFTYDGQNKTVSLTSAENSTFDDITISYQNNSKKDAGEYTASATLTFDEDKLILAYGGANLSSGTACQLNWTINKKDLTITVDNKTITYYDAAPAYTETHVGLVDGETLASNNLTPEFSCNYTQGSNVGTYPITITNKTSNNYNVTYTNGTLTVEQKELSINWNNLEFNYDGNIHTPTATAVGVMGSDTVTLVVSGGTKEVGTHTAEATISPANSNYKLPTNKTTTFTINPTGLTVTADNLSITYYDDAPTYTFTVSGLQGLDAAGTATLTCSYTKGSNVGTYDINVSNLVLSNGSISNYNVTYVKGTLTVNNANITNVTVSDCEAEHTGSALTPNPTKSATSLNSQTISWQYKTSGGSYSSTIPTFTDMGEHTIYYKVSAPNHNDFEGSFTFGIYYLITFAAGAHGTGTMSPVQIYTHTYTATNGFTANTGYHFSGWTATGGATVSGNNVSNINSSITLTANWTLDTFTITWLNDDNSLIDTTTVNYGETPTHAAPSKAATAQYTYTFSGWTPSIVEATADATYTATYSSTVNAYTITWKNHDGTTLETDTNVAYGTTPTYNGATPTKAATAQYTYEFSGWNPSITSVTGDATYTATFNEIANGYTITWKNYDGTVLETDTGVLPGTTPTYDGATPTKPSDAQYDYTFNGWTPAISSVTGDAVYTAAFSSTTRSYTVTWKNYDGTVLETDSNVLYGTTPNYDGSTPTRANGTQERYKYTGWDKEIAPVTQNETYTAQFGIIVAYFAADTSQTFVTIEDALNAASSGTIVIIEPAVDSNSASSPNKVEYEIKTNCEVKSGVTLVIPTSKQLITNVTSSSTLSTYIENLYKDTGNRTTANGYAASTTNYATSANKYLRVTVTIKSNVTLTNNGTIVVSGYLTGNNNAGITGQTANSYSQIKMESGSKIIQNNSSATVHCYGYIIESSKNNNSEVQVTNGTIYLPFIIDDYRGFSFEWSLTYNSNEALNTKRASAFNQFEIRNIYSETTINYNAKVICRGNFYVNYSSQSVDEHFQKDINIVGNASGYMIQFTDSNSYLEYKFDKDTTEATLKLFGSMKLNSLSISLSKSIVTVNLSTGNSFFPLSYHQQVELYSVNNANATFDLSSQRLKILPGSSLTIGNNCTLSGSEIIVYSAFLDGSIGNGKSSSCAYNGVKYPIKNGGILKVNDGGAISVTSLAGTVYGNSSSIIKTNSTITSYEPWSVSSSGSVSPAWKISEYLLIKEQLDVHPLSDFDKLKLYVGMNTFNNYNSYLPSINVIESNNTYNVDTYQRVLHFNSISQYSIELVKNIYVGYKNTTKYLKNETLDYSSVKNIFFVNSTLSILNNNGGVNEFNIQSISISCSTPLVNGEVPSYIDSSIQLVANVVDIDKIYDKTITWISSDTSIATITSNGLFTGHTIGTCIITATCDGMSATYSVTVKEEPQLESLEYITITDNKGNSSETVKGSSDWGGSKTEDYNGAYSNGANITFTVNVFPSTAPYASIKWTFNASAAGRQYVNDNTQATEIIENTSSVIVHIVSGSGASDDKATLKCEVTDLGGNVFTKTFIICHNADTQVCITPDTEITLYDGSQKKIKELLPDDLALVFNHFTGQFESMYVYNLAHNELDDSLYEVLTLQFDNGAVLDIIGAHRLFDIDLKQYVNIKINNINDYVGHRFLYVKYDGKMITTIIVTLESYIKEIKNTKIYSPITFYNYNLITNGILTAPGNLDGIFNYLVMNNDYKYDEERLQADIEEYGLYTYDDFSNYISEDLFELFNGKYLKISVGKGNCTFEDIIELLKLYVLPYIQ